MNRYTVPPTPGLAESLAPLERGIARVGILSGYPTHPGCALCLIEAQDGSIVELVPTTEDLEFKFEVFPIAARVGTAPSDVEWHSVELTAPVTVSPLETEEWLDPEMPCGETVGHKPIMQCQGPIGSAPESATAVCRYCGGVQLIGANGRTLFVCTASFVFTLHVEGLAGDERVRRGFYGLAPGPRLEHGGSAAAKRIISSGVPDR